MIVKQTKNIVRLAVIMIMIAVNVSLFADNNVCDSVIIKEMISLSYDNINDYDKAKVNAQNALNLAKSGSCIKWIAETYYNKGYVYYYYDDNDSAIICYQKALEYYSKENNTKGTLKSINWLAHIYYIINDLDNSLEYCHQGLSLFDSVDYKSLKADFYFIMGSCLDDKGELDRSIKALLQAEKLFEDVGDNSGLIAVDINIGVIYIQNQNYPAAIEYFEKIMKLAEDTNDSSAISICYNNLGEIYHLQNENELALDYYLKSLAMDRKLGDNQGVAIGFNNVGDSYLKLGDTVMAMSYYTKCRKIALENSYPVLATVETRIADVNLCQGNLNEALKYAKLSLENAKEFSGIKTVLKSYSVLFSIYEAMGDFKNAFYFLERYKETDDSINTLVQSQFISELTTRYNVDNQRLKIEELQKQKKDSKQVRQLLIIVIVLVSLFIVILFLVNQMIRKSRRAVRNHKQYYEKILEGSEDYIFVVSAEGRTKYISPSYERRIGRAIKDRIGGDSFEFIHPDDIEYVKKKFRDLVKDNKMISIDFRIMKSDGEYVVIHAVGQNFLDDGLIEGILVNFWDITERVKSEKVIKENEIKYRQIFSAFPDIYFHTTMSGEIKEITPSVEKITGYSRDELISGKVNLGSLITEGWDRVLSDLEENLEVNDIDIKLRKKSGEIINCSFTSELLFSDNSSPVYIVGVIHDISVRIKNQQKINESQKELKEANESKEKLFSIIAHDLIGPIGTNKSIVDLIVSQMNELTFDEVVSLIASLKPSLDATFALIENLLSWARIQQDRLIPNIEKISLVKMVSTVINILESQAKKKSINLVFKYNADSVIMADRNQLDIALRNIVSNAIKFSKISSSVAIVLKQQDGFVDLKVIDSGIGMDQTDIDRLFNENMSIKVRHGTDNEKGTGFGLLIVKEFVQNNKGVLSAVSSPGKGTTFTMRFKNTSQSELFDV